MNVQNQNNPDLVNPVSESNQTETASVLKSVPGADAANSAEKPPTEAKKIDEIYDCCICRTSSIATTERPIGIVALIQPTSGKKVQRSLLPFKTF
jgi:hypothetical protein